MTADVVVQERIGGRAVDAPASAPAAPSAFRRYAPTVAAVLVIALCIVAGNWQRARMHYKEGLRTQYDAAVAAPPLRNAELPQVSGHWASLRYRPVEIEGSFDASHQIFLDNQVREGKVGYDVLAPLRLPDGRTVLVDRGWVPQGRSRAELPVVPPPSGSVQVRGRIELPPAGYLEFGGRQGVPAGPVWQHLDIPRLASATGLDLMPVLVQQTTPAGSGDVLRRAWPAPDFGIDTHKMYMLQWYAFAITTLVFWAAAHWRRRSAAGTGEAS